MPPAFLNHGVYADDTRDISFDEVVPIPCLPNQELCIYEHDSKTLLLEPKDKQYYRVCIIDLSEADYKRRETLLHDFRYLQGLDCRQLLTYKHWYLDPKTNKLYVTYNHTFDITLNRYVHIKARENGELLEDDILIILVQLLCMARYLSSLALTNTEWIRFIFHPTNIYVSSLGLLCFDYAKCFEASLSKTINEDLYNFLAPELLVKADVSSYVAYNLDTTTAQFDANVDTSVDRFNDRVKYSVLHAHKNIINAYTLLTNTKQAPPLQSWELMQSFDERLLVWSIGYLALNMCLYNRDKQQQQQQPQARSVKANTLGPTLPHRLMKVDGVTVNEYIPSLVSACIIESPGAQRVTDQRKRSYYDSAHDDVNVKGLDLVAVSPQKQTEERMRHERLAKTRFLEVDCDVPQEISALINEYGLHKLYSVDLIDFIGRALKASAELRPLVGSVIGEIVFFNALKDIGQHLEYRDPHGNTPLHLACAYGQANLIIDSTSTLSYVKLGNNYRQSASMVAAYMGNSQHLDKLIEYEYNCRDSAGRTALMYAASQGHVECIHKCIMEVKQVDNENRTALIYAVENGHWGAVEILSPFESGQRPDDGQPAICIAAKKGYARCLRGLLSTEQEFLAEVMRLILYHPAALALKELSDEAIVQKASGIYVKNNNVPYTQKEFALPESCAFIDFAPTDTPEERDRKIRGMFLIIKTHCKKIGLMHHWETEEEFVEKILTGNKKASPAVSLCQNLSEKSSMYVSF